MSSFLVSAEGLSMLADGIADSIFSMKISDFSIYDEDLNNYFRGYTINEIFEELNYLNAHALEQRYGDNIEENMYKDGYSQVKEYTIEAYLKMLDCFIYQCCEGDNVDDVLYKIMCNLAETIGSHVSRKSLPYIEASWG